jgi:hypothetical protein
MIKAEVIAHSIHAKHKHELITFVAVFPRIILAELNTHRMFSRNSASSRAIPSKKMIESLKSNPFIPIAWQKEHKGMQGTEYFTEQSDIDDCYMLWMDGLEDAIERAEMLMEKGITKQLCNRGLESYMWHTAIITTSKEGLDNFFDLRLPKYVIPSSWNEITDRTIFKSRREVQKECYNMPFVHMTELDWLKINEGQAEIHMMALAEAMYDAYNESVPEELQAGEWHIPYKQNIQKLFPASYSRGAVPDMAYISSVMCARVSYTVPDHELSEWTYEKYLEKATGLVLARPLHASPFEHCGPAMTDTQ